MKAYPLSLHVFRRDLRLVDNTALISALSESALVVPCFIFDTRQIENNGYKSENCIQFMVHSLQELDADLKKKKRRLYIFSGITEEIIPKLIQQLSVKAIFINRDYTPFSRARDAAIEKICLDHHIQLHIYGDALLHEPEEVLKENGHPYTVFTPFFKKASQLKIKTPQKNPHNNYYVEPIPLEDKQILSKLANDLWQKRLVKGGRKEALKLLENIKNLKDYETVRDVPALAMTTHLSAHNKFGTLSIREFYQQIVAVFNKSHPLIKQLYWRDFFTHILFYFPSVLGESFQKKYKHIEWQTNKKHFHAWCEGQTGFPIVDAGMRELNATGYMQNRVRMIVASFLTKDLHIDWRLGEKYFAQKLVDYDPALNNGNWQWAASTGCDAQPYFRIFNPWLQQQKFDPECIYIKKWIPELNEVQPKIIHSLYKINIISNYPNPIVDHAKESELSKNIYKGYKLEGDI